jgi:hypothetical protein
MERDPKRHVCWIMCLGSNVGLVTKSPCVLDNNEQEAMWFQ